MYFFPSSFLVLVTDIQTKKIDVKLVFFSVPFYSNRVQEPHSFKRGKQI